MSEFKKLVTTEELAKHLKTHPQYVRDQARLGLLPAYKIGRHWRFKIPEVESQIEKNAKRAVEISFSTQISSK